MLAAEVPGMKRVFSSLVTLRWLLLVAVLLSLLPAGELLPKLSTNNTIDSFLGAAAGTRFGASWVRMTGTPKHPGPALVS